MLYLSPLSLKDLAYQITSLMKLDARRAGRDITTDIVAAAREAAWLCVRNVLEKAMVAPTGATEVLGAFTYKRVHDDFEDNLVLAALDAVDGHLLMTHDAKLPWHIGESCITAEEGLQLFDELDAK